MQVPALTQDFIVVLEPLVQSRLPVPLLATRFPGVIMSRSRKLVEPPGNRAGG